MPAAWFLGLRFSLIDMAGTLALLQGRPADAPFVYVSTPNAQHVVRIQRGQARAIAAHDQAWLTPCDSRVLILLARMFGLSLPLVTGSDLTRHMFESVIDRDEPVTVIGGDAELAHRLRSQLGLTRLSLFDPPFGFYNDPAEMARAADYVETHRARFVFIACGTPQSELLGVLLQARGRATGVGLTIGASLQFITGQVKRAPRLWQVLSLEWLFRLLQEPRRMGRRLVQDQLPILPIVLRFLLQPGLASDHTRRGPWR